MNFFPCQAQHIAANGIGTVTAAERFPEQPAWEQFGTGRWPEVPVYTLRTASFETPPMAAPQDEVIAS